MAEAYYKFSLSQSEVVIWDNLVHIPFAECQY